MDCNILFADPESERIRNIWTELATHTDQADPFCCAPAWQLAFQEACDPKRRLLIKESSGSMLAFAETFAAPDDIFLTPIETGWFFGCPLLGKHAVELLADTLRDLISA